MIIGSIKNGMVIDHITAGRAMELYDLLGLSNADCEVALIKNAVSGKMVYEQVELGELSVTVLTDE